MLTSNINISLVNKPSTMAVALVALYLACSSCCLFNYKLVSNVPAIRVSILGGQISGGSNGTYPLAHTNIRITHYFIIMQLAITAPPIRDEVSRPMDIKGDGSCPNYVLGAEVSQPINVSEAH